MRYQMRLASFNFEMQITEEQYFHEVEVWDEEFGGAFPAERFFGLVLSNHVILPNSSWE